MATTAKRQRVKSAARKSVRKVAAGKPVARKKVAAKKMPKRAAPAASKAKKAKKAAKTTKATKPAKATKAGNPSKLRTLTRRKAKPAKPASRSLSPEAKKNLAVQHLWELVEEKKRRAAQPPLWQNIGHHDHSVPGSTTVHPTTPDAEPEKFHIGGRLDRGGG
jgi:hypothetical protein